MISTWRGYLVQGVDVWLNTPRRPLEASGTSGQKAALNGVLNFSSMDGWWREGYNGYNGWAIGDDTDYADPNRQDEADAESLYDTLENEIVPLYYTNRSADGLPGEWLARVKESIRTDRPAIQHATDGQRIYAALPECNHSGKSHRQRKPALKGHLEASHRSMR